MAVPAMILFTWAITNFAASRGHRLTSYVDNWAVQTHSSRSVMDFLQVAHAATSSLKLILNPDKTRAYSTTAAGRSFLHSVSFQGFPLQVALKVSDLGVNFNSSTLSLTHNPVHMSLMFGEQETASSSLPFQAVPRCWWHTLAIATGYCPCTKIRGAVSEATGLAALPKQ